MAGGASFAGGEGELEKPELLQVAESPRSLLGLRLSAILLAILGSFFGLYAVFYLGIGCVLSIRRWHGAVAAAHDGVVASLIAGCLCAGLACICFKATPALLDAQAWAACTAKAFGGLLLLFSGIFVYALYHPERQGLDDAFAIIFMPFTIGAGLWWVVCLNLAHVRREFRIRRSVLHR